MTNSTTNTTHDPIGINTRPVTRRSDEAPMVITRLAGWIDVGEVKTTTQSWIVPTRVNGSAR